MNRSRKLRLISILLTIFCVAVFSTEVLAQKKGGGSSGTFFRIRGLQASSLMIGPVERGVYKQ